MNSVKFVLCARLLFLGILGNRLALAQTATIPTQTSLNAAAYEQRTTNERLVGQLRRKVVVEKAQSQAYLRELQALKHQQQQAQNRIASLLVGLAILSLLLLRTWWQYRSTEQQRQLLEEQATELQAINANKDKLFAIVSHDLRAPVNNLHYVLREFQQTNRQPHEWASLLTQLMDRTGLLSRLINNLLYWSLAQQGLLRDREEQVDLSEVMAECLAVFNDAIQRKELDVQVSGLMPCMRSDENQMLIIIRNLVDNAVKFSPVGGIVQIRWTTSLGGASLEVYNEITPNTKLLTGANLGLRVVNELVTRQKGSMKTNLPGNSCWQVSVHWPADLVIAEMPLHK